MEKRNEVVHHQQQTSTPSIFSDASTFEHAQRIAKTLSSSSLVPSNYQGNIANTLVALSVANRTNNDPLMVMQNLHIIKGRPSWSSQFIIASLNSCGKFSPLRFKMEGDKGNETCYAYATELSTGEILQGPPVSIAMAKAEGWFSKKDKYGNETSKWQSMPILMLNYRAATFFGRMYAPEFLMGMKSSDEIEDIAYVDVPSENGNTESTIVKEFNEKSSEETPIIEDNEELV